MIEIRRPVARVTFEASDAGKPSLGECLDLKRLKDHH
jgi:hypothetical protein